MWKWNRNAKSSSSVYRIEITAASKWLVWLSSNLMIRVSLALWLAAPISKPIQNRALIFGPFYFDWMMPTDQNISTVKQMNDNMPYMFWYSIEIRGWSTMNMIKVDKNYMACLRGSMPMEQRSKVLRFYRGWQEEEKNIANHAISKLWLWFSIQKWLRTFCKE